MEFRELIKKSTKTNEKLLAEDVESNRKSLYNVAEYIYNRIKDEILRKASSGKHDNRIITGILGISLVDKSTYNEYYKDDPCFPDRYYNYFTGITTSGYKTRTGFISMKEHKIHTLSLSINNLHKVLEVFNVINEIGKKDGISISQPFLHAEVFTLEPPRRLIREMKIPIQDNKLEYTLKYDSYHDVTARITRTGESGSIQLALEYKYIM